MGAITTAHQHGDLVVEQGSAPRGIPNVCACEHVCVCVCVYCVHMLA